MKNFVINMGEDRYLVRIGYKLVVFEGQYLVIDFFLLYLQEEELRFDGGVWLVFGFVFWWFYNCIGDDRLVYQYFSVRNVMIIEFNE